MTPQQMREAVAEFVGFENIQVSSEHEGMIGLINGKWEEIPHYCNSLDAIAQAEAKLTQLQAREMNGDLNDIVFRDATEGQRYTFIWRATAAQRCEALLRTIGKWTEDER